MTNVSVKVTAIRPATTLSRPNSTRRVERTQTANAVHDRPMMVMSAKATRARVGITGSVNHSDETTTVMVSDATSNVM